MRGASVGRVTDQVVDSICNNEYNGLAGKLAGTVKHKKISERVHFRLISKKRRIVTAVTAVKRICSGRTSHISHQGSVVLHINLVNLEFSRLS